MNLKEWLEDYELSKLADDKSIDNKSKILFILEIEYNHLEITQYNIIKSNEEMLKYLPDDEISKESREINIKFFNKNLKRMIEIKEKISLLTSSKHEICNKTLPSIQNNNINNNLINNKNEKNSNIKNDIIKEIEL
jgi:hypothetical protein